MGHPKMMEVFEHAIEQGKTVLVENMGESIDAVLAPVIGRNFIKRGNNSRKKFIRLGEKEIEWNDNFKLYLHTMLSNPHYPPEVHAECTIINFTVTEQGLEDQLLFQTVRLERSDLAAQKSDLISQQNEFKLKLTELESLLLDKLANAQGDVLEDTELILSLEDAKRTSDEVREKVEIAKQTESIINRTSEYYRPCAVRGSLLFFFLMDLQKIHSFYRFSLESFVSVFTRAIQSSRHRPASSRKSSVSHVSSPAGSTTLSRRQGLSRDFDASSSAGGDETGSQNGDDATELSVRDLEMRVDLLTKTVSKSVFAFASRGLFDQDRLTAATMLCLTILRRSGALSSVEVDLFVQGSMHANPPPLPDQQKSWLSETSWSQLKQLELSIPTGFKSLTASIEQEALSWKRWIGEEKAESCDLPRSIKDVSPFHKLMLLRILRPDRLCQGLSLFVSSKLGPEFVERAPFDIDKLYAESSNSTPIFFVLFPGVDPTPLVENLAKRLGITNGKFINISMGQGQEQIALNALSTAAKEGGWIMLQNIHLMQSWLKQLERALEQIDDPHPEFRCFLSSEPPPLPLMEVVPESILQKSVKIADEAPQDIKSNLRRAWSKFSQRSIEESAKPREFKACLFGLCLYHSLIIGRKKFGPQGWSRSYPFNDGDLEFSASVIANYLRKYESVPWPDLRYIISEIVYGGSITDALDRRTNKTYVDGLIVPELLSNMTMTPGVKSPDPSKMDYAMYTKFIEERLPAESPQMFGLHPNAEYKFSSSQALGLLGTIQSVTGGSSSSAKSSSDPTLPALITKYLSQLPKAFDMLAIRGRITDWNPYIIVALQECERMNALVSEIRRSLTELEMGLSGALNITDQMEDLIRSMSINKVFGNWEKLAFPSLKPLSSWMTDLSQRAAQLADWTTNLQAPKSVWISGLFNPMSYLTAVMQVAAREHNLPLDSMTLRCSVTNLKDPKIELSPASPPPPKGGVYIHGLFLEGASWEDGKGDEEGYLADPRPKVLHPLVPVVNVYAVPAKEMEWQNMYHCPVYITSTRGPTYLFTANIHMEPDDEERKWILAGTALLLTDD
jgi:dynein heavy chain